jgi:hypothetical protein
MTEDDDHAGPRRAVSADLLTSRAARQLVKPVNDKLGDWQAASVKLETQVRRLAATDSEVDAQVRDLQAKVTAEAALFQAALREAPEPIRQHGRVVDTLTVLRLLEERIGRVITTLDELPPRRR